MVTKGELSPRQTQIMGLAAEGMTDKEIALRLGLSVGTLRSHWDRMRMRMGVVSRSAIIARVAEDRRQAIVEEMDVLHQYLSESRTFVWTAQPDGCVDYCNEWFRDFSGRPLGAFLGGGCRELMSPEENEAGVERWRLAQRRNEGYRAIVNFRNAGGLWVPHHIRLSPMRIVEGTVVRWLGSAIPASPFDR